MKLDYRREATDNLPSVEEGQFQVAINGKTFKILLSDLYTHKERAMIRELMSNAVDAHRAAGTSDVPFDIYMPNSLYPMFKIRDYGTGLSHEQVMTLYVTLFASTKDDSNDDTGQFGMGSKVPFAYTDTFTVISYFNGTRSVYLCYLDETNTPRIKFRGSEPTDEPNGLQIEVAVREGDYSRFGSELRHLLLGLRTQPNIIGMDLDPIVPSFISPEGDVFVIPRSHYGSPYAIRQGSAIYPVPGGYEAPHPSLARNNYDSTIVVDVPIGSVTVAPNREQMVMDDRTIQAIEEATYRAGGRIVAEAQQALDEAPNRLAALHALEPFRHSAMLNLMTLDYSKFNKTGTTSPWKGDPYIDLTSGGPGWKAPLVRVGKTRKEERLSTVNFRDIPGMVFVLRYTKNPVKREMLRYREFCDSTSKTVMLWTDPDKRSIARLMRLCGFTREQFVWVGSLEDPGPPQRNSNPDKVLSGVNYHSTGWSARPVKELPEEFLFYRLETYNSRSERIIMDRRISDAVSAGLIPENMPILTMTAKAAARYNVDDTRNVDSYMQQRLADRLNDPKFRKALFDRLMFAKFEDATVRRSLGYSLPENNDEITNWINMAGFAVYADVEDEVDVAYKTLTERYPLLFDRSESVVQSYIKQRDAELKAKETV